MYILAVCFENEILLLFEKYGLEIYSLICLVTYT